jgi:uncharacterized repeat protein (TIGR01451 family)
VVIVIVPSSKRPGILAFVVLALAASVQAQPYEIRWHSIDGGGTSRAAGGALAVGGTIGQPDAGFAVASPYGIGSGFWAATLSATGAELQLSVVDSPDPVALGGNLAYTIVVRNAGPADAPLVVVDVPTPPGLAFVSSSGDCTTAFPCSLGAIPAGASRTIVGLFHVPAGYAGANPIVTTIAVSAATPDPNPATGVATARTAVGTASADLQVMKLGPAITFRGADVVYSITVTNAGPSEAPAVEVSDAASPGLVFVSNKGDCQTAFPCSVGAVPPGTSRVITSTFRVPLGYTGPDPIVNTASALSAAPDPNPLDNSDDTEAEIVIPPGVDFYIVAPCRVLDTRNPLGPYGGPAIGARSTRRFTISPRCGIPPTAIAISVTLAVTAPTVIGNLRIFPAGEPVPVIATINYAAGQTRTNNGIVRLSPDSQIDVFSAQESGSIHLILDVNGYFQ